MPMLICGVMSPIGSGRRECTIYGFFHLATGDEGLWATLRLWFEQPVMARRRVRRSSPLMGDGCGVATLAAGSCLPGRGNSDADEAVHPTRLKIDGQDAASAEIDFASLHRACDSNR